MTCKDCGAILSEEPQEAWKVRSAARQSSDPVGTFPQPCTKRNGKTHDGDDLTKVLRLCQNISAKHLTSTGSLKESELKKYLEDAVDLISEDEPPPPRTNSAQAAASTGTQSMMKERVAKMGFRDRGKAVKSDRQDDSEPSRRWRKASLPQYRVEPKPCMRRIGSELRPKTHRGNSGSRSTRGSARGRRTRSSSPIQRSRKLSRRSEGSPRSRGRTQCLPEQLPLPPPPQHSQSRTQLSQLHFFRGCVK